MKGGETMSRQTELIDAISNEKKTIMELTQELQERYRILSGHFVSAKLLVEPEKWEDWLSANCDINHESADFIMTQQPSPPDINQIFLTNTPLNLLGFSSNSEEENSNGKTKTKKRSVSRSRS